jgi:NadR type nicotinamide-nucleotide adenylyltransferase
MSITMKKIVVIGPESTGKSTLSEALAQALHTSWAPEYARQYLEEHGPGYVEDDLLAIARGQVAAEDAQALLAHQYLICDTDLHVVKVWAEYKYGRVHPWIVEEIARRKYDLYLLTDIDLPWQDDPLREHPQPEMRQYFYEVYRKIVADSGVPFVEIRGGERERLQTALHAIGSLAQ